MIDYTAAGQLMAEIKLGEEVEQSGWPVYPRLDSDGRIIMLTGEEVLTVQSARRVAQEGFVLPEGVDLGEMFQHLNRRKVVTSLRATTVYVTNLRTLWVVDKPLAPGTLVAGHVWHAWLSWVEFNPQQSFFIDATLSLHFTESFGDGTKGWFGHFVEFGFDKRFDPASLGAAIARSVARHHLDHGAPEACHPELRALLTANPPPRPSKGESMTLTFPTNIPFPSLPAPLQVRHASASASLWLTAEWLNPGVNTDGPCRHRARLRAHRRCLAGP